MRITTEKVGWLRRVGWFFGLYIASFAVVAVVALVLRTAIRG